MASWRRSNSTSTPSGFENSVDIAVRVRSVLWEEEARPGVDQPSFIAVWFPASFGGEQHVDLGAVGDPDGVRGLGDGEPGADPARRAQVCRQLTHVQSASLADLVPDRPRLRLGRRGITEGEQQWREACMDLAGRGA